MRIYFAHPEMKHSAQTADLFERVIRYSIKRIICKLQQFMHSVNVRVYAKHYSQCSRFHHLLCDVCRLPLAARVVLRVALFDRA